MAKAPTLRARPGWVIVQSKPHGEVSMGGILLPDTVRYRDIEILACNRGTVLSVGGPKAFTDEWTDKASGQKKSREVFTDPASELQVGDPVLFKWANHSIPQDGGDIHVVRGDDIVAIDYRSDDEARV